MYLKYKKNCLINKKNGKDPLHYQQAPLYLISVDLSVAMTLTLTRVWR